MLVAQSSCVMVVMQVCLLLLYFPLCCKEKTRNGIEGKYKKRHIGIEEKKEKVSCSRWFTNMFSLSLCVMMK